MKRVLTIIILLVCTLMTRAQNISVSSFRLLENDLDANTAGTMEKDQNGEVAALIKVVTTQTGFTFDGGALGIVKTVQKPGEIWVYVPRGLKKITISHSQLGVLRDYYLPMAVASARTYEMVLVTGTVETTIRQARTSQYVVFQLTPPNAFVELDGEVLQTDGGIATKMMKFGTYNYRVQAPNYLPEAGNVTVNDPKNKHVVTVALKPNFSTVTLKVDGDAEIWVNGERKGTGSWTGNLGAGTYEFETRKPNHRSFFTTRDIIVSSEPQVITLQAPTPILAEADINSSPAMADIYIDGKKVGQTPQLVPDLLVGQHQLRISKQGFKDYSVNLMVREGETSMISAKLEKDVSEYANVSSGVSTSIGDRQTTSGRAKSLMVEDGEVLSLANQQYQEFMKTARLSTSAANTAMVKRVGQNLANAVTNYMTANGLASEIANFNWTFNLVQGNQVNAWCMPGGLIVVYEGLLPVTQDEVSLAIVLGHEIAHAVARHSAEQLSTQMKKLGKIGKGTTTTSLIGTVVANGFNFKNLSYSRSHESEADHMGMIFAAMAGYDPQSAITFWQRMATNSTNMQSELMNSHPFDETRLSHIQGWMPEALQYYKKGGTTQTTATKATTDKPAKAMKTIHISSKKK